MVTDFDVLEDLNLNFSDHRPVIQWRVTCIEAVSFQSGALSRNSWAIKSVRRWTTVLSAHRVYVKWQVDGRGFDHVEKISWRRRQAAYNRRRLPSNLFSLSPPPVRNNVSSRYCTLSRPNRISAQFSRSPTLFTRTTFIRPSPPVTEMFY